MNKDPKKMSKDVKNPKILAIAGGFYYFGDEIDAPEGYVAMTKVSMFGGFAGNSGLPAVARGDKSMTVNLDRFDDEIPALWPISSCYGILPSVNLYEFSGTTIR